MSRNLVQKQSYGYDRQEARKYFTYDNVRDGILKLTEDMFGVDIRPWKTPKWDKLAEAYEVYDHGKLIGRFYFDAHPRPGKYEHANAVPLCAPDVEARSRSARWFSTCPERPDGA